MSLDKSSIEDIFPMSEIEQGMVYYTLKNPEAAIYHDQGIYEINDPGFSGERFIKAVTLLLEKHPILRTSFNLSDYKMPVQIVHKKLIPAIGEDDLSAFSTDKQKEIVQAFLEKDRNETFDVAKAPLWRIHIFKISEVRNVIVWSFHHAILDGWSNASFLTELLNTYFRLKEEPGYIPEKLKHSYKDFIVEQLLIKSKADIRDYWVKELEGFQPLRLPSHYQESKETGMFHIEESLSPDLLAELKKTSKIYNCSLRTLLFSAFSYTLNLFSYREDFVVGLVENNRPVVEDGEKILGCFLNTVPVRIVSEGYSHWQGFVRAMEHKLVELKRVGKLPLSEIFKVAGVSVQASNPLFDVIFNYVDFHVYDQFEAGGKSGGNSFDIKAYEKTNTLFDFTISTTGKEFKILLNFSAALISKEKVEELITNFRNVLVDISDFPHAEISREKFIPIPSEGIIGINENDLEQGSHAYVLNAGMKSLPAGVPGEIFLNVDNKLERTGFIGLCKENKISVLGEVKDFFWTEKIRPVTPTKEYVSATDAIEDQLTHIWQEMLGLNRIGIDESFFELGGHSLNAAIMAGRIRKKFKVKIPISKIFEYPTIRDIAGMIRDGASMQESAIPLASQKELYPLSPSQKRLFIISQFENLSTSYNMSAALQIQGNLDVEKLNKAFADLVKRHETLRTSFEIVDGEVVQRIASDMDFRIEYDPTESFSEDRVRSFIRPFDLHQAPLLRVKLIYRKEQQYVLLFDMHHIISDGFSMGILVQEFMQLYQGKKLTPLKLQYKDFVEWRLAENKASEESQEKFWKDQLKGELPVLQLPTDFQRPLKMSFTGDRVRFVLSKDQLEGLKSLGKESGTTLFMTLLGIYKILLSKYSNQEDIIVGTPVAGRNQDDLQPIIGMFINTLAIRSFPDPQKTFASYLQELKTVSLAAFENQDHPLEQLIEKLGIRRDMSRNALFDTMFVLQNMEISELDIEGLKFTPYVFENKTSKYDLTLEAEERGSELHCNFEFSTALFTASSIELMAKRFTSLVNRIIAKPSARLEELVLLEEAEKNRLLFDFNKNTTTYPKPYALATLFEMQVKEDPRGTALAYADDSLSYKELNVLANRIAWNLLEKGVKQGDIIAVVAERGFLMIAGILGILKTGAAYLPIDPDNPEDRIQFILTDSKAHAVLCRPEFEYKISHKNIVSLSEERIISFSEENPGLSVDGASDAYIIYTSGSTGRPKGTVVRQFSVSRVVKNTNYIAILPEDRLLQLSNYAFDGSVFDIFGALLNGASLVILPKDAVFDVQKLAHTIVEKKISVFFFTTALFNTLVDIYPECLRSVRKVLFGGEKVSVKHVEKAFGLTGPGKMIHVYGPTESTVFSHFYAIDSVGEFHNIPIGKPLANTSHYILNQKLQPVPIGIEGELFIGGDGLAREYLNNPILTEEKFIENPFVQGERIYKTGDLVKMNSDGNLVFIGRKDTQVKIRGFRIELEEIEKVLCNCKGIKEAAVIAKREENGNVYLTAFFTSDSDISGLEIKNELAKTLPEYMLPGGFMRIENIPLNANGKINRKYLETIESVKITAEYEAPENETEKTLSEIWSSILTIPAEGISTRANFFDLGGHSLRATVLVSQIHKQLNADVPLAEVFKSPTIKELAAYIKGTDTSIFRAIEKAIPAEFYPLSAAQKRIYLLTQLEGAGLSYNMPGALEVEGKINKIQLESAFRKLIERHESLRTTFEMQEGTPFQRISVVFDFEVSYFTSEREHLETTIQQFIKPFDLSKAPLLRIALVSFSERQHVLLFDMHHIISDGVSMGILTNEFIRLYQDEHLPEIKLQYKDFAVWQQHWHTEDQLARHEVFWMEKFKGELPVLDLPTDFKRPVLSTFEGDRISFKISATQSLKLKRLAKDHDSTLYMSLLSVYTLLLSRYTGQEDIIVGSPVAGRPHADLQKIIGMFVNTLPMRNNANAQLRFGEFLKAVKNTAMDAFKHQDFPFEMLVEKLNLKRDLSRNPLFDVMFAFQNVEFQALNIEGLSFRPYEYEHRTSKFDLTLDIFEEEDHMTCELEFSTSLFKSEFAKQFAGHFLNLIDQILLQPDARLDEYEILSPLEKQKILTGFNDNKKQFDVKPFQYYFDKQVRENPDQPAIEYNGEVLSYRALDRKTSEVAQKLITENIGKNDVVAVLADKSIEMITGILGTIKAGAAYLPIDTRLPVPRVTYMLENAGCKVLLTNRDVPELKVKCIDLTKIGQAEYPFVQPSYTLDDLAYVIYTSGSTGLPKGVMVEQKAMISKLLVEVEQYRFNQSLVTLQLTNYAFDVSLLEIFIPLMIGGKIVIPEAEKILDPLYIDDLIRTRSVTDLNASPAFLKMLLQSIGKNDQPHKVKRVTAGGESFLPELVNMVRSTYPGASISNLYGPTEAVIEASILPDIEEFPHNNIGKPMLNTFLYVLSGSGKPQPIGVYGELYIGGESLARGYVNNEKLSSEKFVFHLHLKERVYRTGDIVRWKADGSLEFKGREDDQIKIRGYRIEPGEIVMHLKQIEKVKDAVVLSINTSHGETELGAYLVSEEHDVIKIRQSLKHSLPEYMQPAFIQFIEEIPLNASGKVDKSSLPPFMNVEKSMNYADLKGKTENALEEIWKEVLGKTKIGAEENFFEIGGHSLKAAYLLARINKYFSTSLNLRDVFQHPTIRSLALKLEGEVSAYSEISTAPHADHYPLSFAQKRLWIMDQMLGGKNPAYNMPSVFEIRGPLNTTFLAKAIQMLLERHDVLRTRFITVEGHPRQEIINKVSFSLEEMDCVGNKDRAAQILEEKANQPFDLGKDLLLKAAVIKTEDQLFFFFLSVHHIVSDGWSMEIINKEIMTFYAALAEGRSLEMPGLPIQYKDFAHWQIQGVSGSKMQEHKMYWQQKLSQPLKALQWINDLDPLAPVTQSGRVLTFEVPSSGRIRKIAESSGTSVFNVMLSIINVFLHKMSGQNEIITGITSSGRNHPDLEGQVGFYINMLPVKILVEENDSLVDVLKKTKSETLESFSHEIFPVELALEEKSSFQESLYHSTFNWFVPFANDHLEIPGLSIQPVEARFNYAKYDLSFHGTEKAEGIELSIEYNTGVFKTQRMELFKEKLLALISDAIECPEKSIKDLNILSEAELMDTTGDEGLTASFKFNDDEW